MRARRPIFFPLALLLLFVGFGWFLKASFFGAALGDAKSFLGGVAEPPAKSSAASSASDAEAAKPLPKVDLVKVDKSERKMYLLSDGLVVRTYHIALGRNPRGHKEQEGDSRTPEGSYTLDYIKEDSSYYRAMHISYPNKIDKRKARQRGVSAGGFIMIHGQKNGFGHLAATTQKLNWTAGCIALTNPEMDEFLSLVKVGTEIQIEW